MNVNMYSCTIPLLFIDNARLHIFETLIKMYYVKLTVLYNFP